MHENKEQDRAQKLSLTSSCFSSGEEFFNGRVANPRRIETRLNKCMASTVALGEYTSLSVDLDLGAGSFVTSLSLLTAQFYNYIRKLTVKFDIDDEKQGGRSIRVESWMEARGLAGTSHHTSALLGRIS
ncbi:hypothetical protein RRG08_006557 [Elysia crispata]|uniref:Uncharacterized protein n=1 Tax=Elysia crispata TaxID=231223 RepID=A0AAE1EBP1_9GAST|nr:hypothetical protein RRG08_006557 [Elysia crispata]